MVNCGFIASVPGDPAISSATAVGDLGPVKKFTDRKSAVARIWKATQEAATPAPKAPKGAPKKAKATKTAKAKDAAPAREGSKKAIVLDLLRRKGGATWQRSPKRPTGRTTASGDSSAEHSARK